MGGGVRWSFFAGGKWPAVEGLTTKNKQGDYGEKKTKAGLAARLPPTVCVCELLEHREAGRTKEICKTQFTGGPGTLTPEEFSRILIAYEPVWAIGTGKTATPEIAAAVHRFLRKCAERKFSPEQAQALRIFYGGSVKPDNIQGLMAQEELDGALVGRAILEPKSFASIVNGCESAH